MLGIKINNYEVKVLIGEGGMGSVYLAEHPMIGRQVAVKVLKPMFATATDVVARFFNEAKAANAIGHPGIVDVLDVGTLPDGMPYLMMEMLRGESLAARIEQAGRLGLDEVVDYGRQAASALGAAHAAGIVHRDLKPANLFLSHDRETPGRVRLKVLDFGIAKLSGSLHRDQVKTGTGAILGTPAYMSPEQSLGRTDGLDHRTDIYSLGLILYHALAGAPPFMAEGFGEMVMLHMTAPPPSLRTKNSAVSAAMEDVVLRALAKNPDDRFQSMAELAVALDAVKGGAPVTAPPAWQPDVGHVPTTAREVALPRTVRLPAGQAPMESSAPPSRSLSTTLSASAVDVSGGAFPTETRRSPIRWVAAGVGGLLAVAVVTVLALSGSTTGRTRSGRVPESSGQPSAGIPLPERRELPPAPALPPRREPVAEPPPELPRPEPEAKVVPEAVATVKAPGAGERRRAGKSRQSASGPARERASVPAAAAVEGKPSVEPVVQPAPTSSPPDAAAPAKKKMKMW